ncbi:alcohol dehydrogenase [Lecanosticta acicola]|uniref:Alcohol dehydrogenase n=1 Tax=Lecanosticta acicola TaxID=111012 RepID=A0AAI8YS98_9PEZI|nr:alcohol dehydrogenase [Lecanosticta acicola]
MLSRTRPGLAAVHGGTALPLGPTRLVQFVLSMMPSVISRSFSELQHAVKPRPFERMRLDDKVIVVTVYCLDCKREPSDQFYASQAYYPKHFGGSLNYERVNVLDAQEMHEVFAAIAAKHQRMDGLVAAAGIQYVKPFIEYPAEEATRMMDINFRGVFLGYQAAACQMQKYDTPGSLVSIASMSGTIANKGLNCCVYNSSKAAVIQLNKNLAMELSPIRCNSVSPGNILTPMVEKNFQEQPELKTMWENGNMLGRISTPEEYREMVVLLLSRAGSFTNGANIIIDGGYTAW